MGKGAAEAARAARRTIVRKSDPPTVRGLTAFTWHLIPLIVHRGWIIALFFPRAA